MIHRTIIPILSRLDLMPEARRPLANGGSWLTSSGGRYTLLVEADARWKTMMEGKWGILLSFTFQNRTKSTSFSVYVGISDNLLTGPHAQTGQNNMRTIPLGATSSAL